MTISNYALTTLLLVNISGNTFSAPFALVSPNKLIADSNMSGALLSENENAARLYATFWDTGNEILARDSLATDFIDKTLPEGREQGADGAIMASRIFRTAVPDLRCNVEQMILAGDRVVSHLHFHGHFTGTFGKLKGKGQKVDFIATDIYQIKEGKIAANWHIEDNLTLMKQLGAI